jgi:hypothetical protein
MLSLAEVRESGRPAYFFEYGEALLYRCGHLFDLRDWRGSLRTGGTASPLPDTVLERSVGIEYGWRHADACDCRLCRPPAAVSLVRAPAPAVQRPRAESARSGGGSVASASGS